MFIGQTGARTSAKLEDHQIRGIGGAHLRVVDGAHEHERADLSEREIATERKEREDQDRGTSPISRYEMMSFRRMRHRRLRRKPERPQMTKPSA